MCARLSILVYEKFSLVKDVPKIVCRRIRIHIRQQTYVFILFAILGLSDMEVDIHYKTDRSLSFRHL
jgi:hypothetical protein